MGATYCCDCEEVKKEKDIDPLEKFKCSLKQPKSPRKPKVIKLATIKEIDAWFERSEAKNGKLNLV